jgi:hypothetical protein
VTLHEGAQLIKHKWKARGRHGTHSPFVYAFVEDLMVPAKSSSTIINSIAPYFGINLISYFGSNRIDINPNAPHVFNKKSNLRFERLLVLDGTSEIFSSLANDCLSQVSPGDVVLVYSLHKTINQSHQWQSLVEHTEVKLSMDLFDLGLLFFRSDFKVKQNFLLKFQ